VPLICGCFLHEMEKLVWSPKQISKLQTFDYQRNDKAIVYNKILCFVVHVCHSILIYYNPS